MGNTPGVLTETTADMAFTLLMEAARRGGALHTACSGAGPTALAITKEPETYEGLVVIKREILPDGRSKLILKDPRSGDFTDRVV